MTQLKIEDIIPDKSRLRILVDSLSDSDFYHSFMKEIHDELGLIEIHNLDEQLMIIKESGVIKNTNNGNSYVSYLIGITTVPRDGSLVKKGGSLPD
jgi:hypothetical protein